MIFTRSRNFLVSGCASDRQRVSVSAPIDETGQDDVSGALESPEAGRRRLLIARVALVSIAIALLGFVVIPHAGDWRMAISDRLAKASKVIAIDYAQTYCWWAAVLNSVILLVLAATSGGWLARKNSLSGHSWVRRPMRSNMNAPLKSWGLRSMLVLLGVMVLATAIRVPRMGLSFYNDEAYSLRRYIVGQFKADPDSDGLRFRQARWTETIWANERGNNPALFSVLARLCHDAWSKSAEAVSGQIKEWPVRLPALIPGLISIAFIAGIGFRVGNLCRAGPKRAIAIGLTAATIAALHPWHVRYSTEARGYGLVMLFSALVVYFLIRALSEDRWRWWLGFGVSAALLMATYFGAVCFLVPVVGAAGIAVLVAGRNYRELFLPLVVSIVLGAALYLQFCAPLLPQMFSAMDGADTMQGGTRPGWWSDVVSMFLAGLPVVDLTPLNPDDHQLPLIAVAVLAAILLIVSTWKIWHSPRLNRLVAAFVLLGAVGSLVVAWLVGNLQNAIMHPWYVIYAMPAICVVISLAIVPKASTSGGLRIRQWVFPAALSVALISSYAVGLSGILTTAKEPLRQVVERTRGDVYPNYLEDPDHPVVAGFWTDAPIYDPHMITAVTPAEIRAAMSSAKSEGREFYVVQGHDELASVDRKAAFDLLRDPMVFELVETLEGLEEDQFRHHIFRPIRLASDAIQR